MKFPISRKVQYSLITFFLSLQILVLYSLSQTQLYENFFWFCDHAPLLFALAFLIRNVDLIRALISVGFLGQLIWIMDFLSKLLLDTHLFNLTNYLFAGEWTFFSFVPILIHFFTSLLALFIIRKEPVRRRVLLYSGVYLVLLFSLSLLFTSPQNNINCVYSLCGLPELTPPFFTLLWLPLTFILMVLPTYYLQKMISKKFS